jgi:erythromycin esterase-like protein
MATTTHATIIETVRKAAYPVDELLPDYDPLFDLIGDARFTLLGEATHGTHEFYQERAHITQRLIEERGVTAVAIEGDWPAAARVNRYVRGLGADSDAIEALVEFRRFPQWMWRNTEVVDFVEWLRRQNRALPPDAPKVGFYGLDLYSLRASMDAVLRHLQQVDPDAAARARARYACFDPEWDAGEIPETYPFAV